MSDQCANCGSPFHDTEDCTQAAGPPDRYPREEGDVIVIGPECFAAKDGSVLSWRGENYRRPSSPNSLFASGYDLGWRVALGYIVKEHPEFSVDKAAKVMREAGPPEEWRQ